MSAKHEKAINYASSCFGKQNHGDPVRALLTCHFIYQISGDSLWPYKCDYCVNWHIGHKPVPVRKMIAALLGVEFTAKRPWTDEQKKRLHEIWNSR